MSWEDEDFEVKLPPKPVAVALPAKSDWEDEEEDATLKEAARVAAAGAAGAGTAAPAAPETVKEKHRRKEIEKEKERKEKEEREAAKKRLEEETPLSDPVAEKKRLEALQMKADLEAARDSLGVGGGAGAKAAAASGSLIGRDTKTLIEAVTLVQSADFTSLGSEVAKRVNASTGKSTTPAMNFYREVLRESAAKLSVEDLNALVSVITVKINEKRAAEKAAKPGKTKSKGAARMMVERDDDYGYSGSYDDYGDVDAPKAAAAAPAAAPAAAAGGEAAAAPAAAKPEEKWSAAALDGDFM